MHRLIPAALFLALGAMLLTTTLLPRPQATAQVLDLAGSEAPEEGALSLNGYNVTNLGAARFRDYYERYQDWLGEPLSGSDGRSQTFRFGRLTANAANPAVWQIELENLGLLDLQREGYLPQPGTSPKPAVRDWLLSQVEVGTDVPRLIGRVISDPICERATHECAQFFDKQRLLFPERATTADQVRRAPLGLWFSRPRTRPVVLPEEQAGLPLQSPGAIGGGLALLLGLLLLIRPGTRTGLSVTA